MDEQRIDLLGLPLDRLQALCAQWQLPKYAARQIADWLYNKRAVSFDQMTNLSLRARAALGDVARIGRSAPVAAQQSSDGTVKYLFEIKKASEDKEDDREINDNTALSSPIFHYLPLSPTISQKRFIESVFIPDADRATLCVSSQVGCKMGCRFCVTGQQGFHGNLSAADILNQVLSIPESDRLTNVVFMGMGEPMDNLDAVLDACTVLTAPWGLGWSPKRITVSSVGLTPKVLQFVEQCQCHLAISLHNPIAAERADIMPVERAYPLRDLLAQLRHFDWSGQRRLSFEYTMLRGINDDAAHAAALVAALWGLDCRVNLIRFHASPSAPFRTSTPSAIAAFRDHLTRHGITCTLRASRGEDIDAACGLLAGKETENGKRKAENEK